MMQKTKIDYSETGILNTLIQAYIEDSSSVHEFYEYSFDFNAFEKIIEEKQKSFDQRDLLHKVLLSQYQSFENIDAVEKNIQLLKAENTFTITTAHQTNIFTGPLYSFYKAISTINTCRQLKEQFPDKNFVPIFWQGSEDHDFEEINHTFLFDKKLEWTAAHQGEAVGRMPTTGFETLIEEVETLLGDRPYAEELLQLLKKAYDAEHSLADAYKIIIHSILGEYGLLILNQDDAQLKKAFIPVLQEELKSKTVERTVVPQINALEKKDFKVQASPRAINLFYIDENNIRNRIVEEEGEFSVLNTDKEWSEKALLEEVETNPERFSPNVFLRPLYQEMVLPNLAYVGGAGELSYWLELKPLFEAFEVPFPMLVLRNMLAMVNSSVCKKIKKLELSPAELFLDEEPILKRFVKKQSDKQLDLEKERKQFEALFERVKKKAEEIDPTLGPSVESVMQGQFKALSNIEQKIVRAEKKKFDIAQNQINSIKSALFPNGSLQERSENFMHFYSVYGTRFIEELMDALNPFDKAFYLLKDD